MLNKECEVGAKCNSTVGREESDSKADSRVWSKFGRGWENGGDRFAVSCEKSIEIIK